MEPARGLHHHLDPFGELLDRTGEIAISSRRADGSDGPWWPIWIVRVGGNTFVRSTDGPDKIWFRNAIRRGRIRAGYTVLGTTFVEHRATEQEDITAAYRAKYRSSPPRSLNRASTSTSTIKRSPHRVEALAERCGIHRASM